MAIKIKIARLMRSCVVPLAMLILSFMHLSFRWPVESPIITSTFGESRWDHFHDGMDVISPDQTVYPVNSGDLVFYWNKARFPFDEYPGIGNYVILDHGNDLISMYGHLVDGIAPKSTYHDGDAIGGMGNTGHSMATHLHFTLYNRTGKKSINPFSVLPKIEDAKQPAHVATWFRIGDRYIQLRDKGNYRITAHHPLLLEITDTISKRERLGVYKLAVQINDRTVLDVEFNEIDSSKNILTVGGFASQDLFDEKGYYRIAGAKYVEGENRVKVIATDFNGNRMESALTISVHLDIKQ